MRYSLNTLTKCTSQVNEFFEYHVVYNKVKLPIKIPYLNMYLLNLGKKQKSIGVVNSLIISLDFILKFFGYNTVGTNYHVKNIISFLEKICPIKKNARDAFTSDILLKLWVNIDKKGGFNKLNFNYKRTFIFIVVSYFSLMRFNCIQGVRLCDIEKHDSYFKIHIRSSKTDQRGLGQTTYLVDTDLLGEGRSPYKLLLTYLNELKSDESMFLLPSLKYCSLSKIWKTETSKISYSTMYKQFKKLLNEFDIDCKKLSLHSMRIGGVTDDFKNSLDPTIIDKKGRWKCSETKFIYRKDSEDTIIKSIKDSYSKK